MKKRQGFMSVDIVFGIIIVASVTAILLGTVHHERTAEAALADSRSALHLAEHAMLNLQHHQPLPAVSGEMSLKVEQVGDGIAPAGFAWAKMQASVHGHHRLLLGVVPTQSLPEAK